MGRMGSSSHACHQGWRAICLAGMSGWEMRAVRSGEGCQKVVAGVSRASLSLVGCGELLDLPLCLDPLPLSLSFSALQIHPLPDARQVEEREQASISQARGYGCVPGGFLGLSYASLTMVSQASALILIL